MPVRRLPDNRLTTHSIPPPITPACNHQESTVRAAPRQVVSSLFFPPSPEPITAEPVEICIGSFHSRSALEDSANGTLDLDVSLEAELFGEDPSPVTMEPTTPHTAPAQSAPPQPEPAESPEDVLLRFYRTRNTKPNYDERIELATETGWLTENIARWFSTKRLDGERGSPKPTSPSKTDFPKAARRPRTTKTKEQLKILEDEFKRNRWPDDKERVRLAAELELSTESVYNWFRHKREKEKRELVGLLI